MNVKTSVGFCAVWALVSAAFAGLPIARWDVIPYQRVDGVFKAGVCAFHEDGVKVEFSVNGKKMYTAEKPILNDRTGVWEYTFPFDTSKFADGPVALNARAITLGSEPESYDLPELSLFANSGKSLNVDSVVWADSENGDDANDGAESAPVKTLAAAFRKVKIGGTVYLKKGLYDPNGLGATNRIYWTTIAAAPGVKRDDVEISHGRPVADKLRFRGVTLFCDNDTGRYCTILDGVNGSTCCWVDDCKMYNKKGRWSANANTFGNGMHAYVTGGETTEMTNGTGGSIIRDHKVYRISSDVWSGSERLVVNSHCWDVDPGTTGAHPDFFQSYAPAPKWTKNVILYNVSGYDCRSQGLFGMRLRDSAFVNVSFQTTVKMHTQWGLEMENVVFAHITLIDQAWLWRGKEGDKGSYAPTDVRVLNCVLAKMDAYKPLEKFEGELKIHHNAFYGKDRKKEKGEGALGDDILYIDRSFKDEASHNYALTQDSPAMKHGISLQCVPADINGKPYPTDARPCGAYAE